jgi:glutaminyl-tRNA synthetase
VNLDYASDYFDQLYEWAIKLIKEGKAYVDDQTAEEIAASRGTPSRPMSESPYRNRSVEENLGAFRKNEKGRIP